jgi:hypothetical protein
VAKKWLRIKVYGRIESKGFGIRDRRDWKRGLKPGFMEEKHDIG